MNIHVRTALNNIRRSPFQAMAAIFVLFVTFFVSSILAVFIYTADPRVKDLNFVTKEQALEIYKKATKDNPLLSELVSPSVFPSSLEFSVTDLSHAEPVISEVKSEIVVDEVGYTASLGGEESLTDVVSRLRQIAFYIRLTGGAFIGFILG